MIAYLLLTNLKAGKDDSHKERIAIAEGAYFDFDSLAPNQRDLLIYHRRLRRYAQRHVQKSILYHLLKEHGLAGMPDEINKIYTAGNLAGVAPAASSVGFLV